MRIKDVTPQNLAAFIKKENLDFKRDNIYNISEVYVKKTFSQPNKSQFCTVQRKLNNNFKKISNLLKPKFVDDHMEYETTKENNFQTEEESQFDITEESQVETKEESQNDTKEDLQVKIEKDTTGEIYREIEEFPKIFEIAVKNSEVYKYPRDARGVFSLSIQNLLYAEFNKVNYACPLQFIRKRLKRDGKCRATYFSSRCLFSTCCKYKIVLKEKNANETVFTVNQIGKLLHLKSEERRRPFTRDLRRNLVVNDPTEDYLANWADKTKAKQISAGNLTGVPTYEALRQIKAVNKKRGQSDKDPLKELHLVQKGLRTKMRVETTNEVCKKIINCLKQGSANWGLPHSKFCFD